jgi:hypothetical protein
MTNESQYKRRLDAAIETLKTTCATIGCPACGKKTDWVIGGAKALIDDTVIPVRCGCGYLMLFSDEVLRVS